MEKTSIRAIPSAGPKHYRYLDRDVAPRTSCHQFLTPEEASCYLGGFNSRTITRWAREGYLPAYPIGEGRRRYWRFLEGELEAWLLSLRPTLFSPETLRHCLPATGAPTKGVSK